MAVIPTGIPPLGVPGSGSSPENQDSADGAVKFESALLQTRSAARSDAPFGVTDQAATASNGGFIDPQTLDAADDAWVRFLAISEQLRSPGLSAEKRDSLLGALAENWRAFKSQSEPIGRLVENYTDKKY
jgi:hypothetical protein